MKRAMDLDLGDAMTIHHNQAEGVRESALSLNITWVRGSVAASPDGEVRGLSISGGSIAAWNVAALEDPGAAEPSAIWNAGGYGIAINNDPGDDFKSFIGAVIEHGNHAGGQGAILIEGIVGVHEAQWNTIRDCTLGNGVVFSNVQDGNRIENCICYGDNPALSASIVYGSHNCSFSHNSVNNRDGAIDLADGSFVLIHDNQIEHGKDVFGATLGDSEATLGGSIILRGLTYKGVGNVIEKCNFGAGVHRGHSIVLLNQRDVVIDKCFFFPGGLFAGASDLYLDVEDLAGITVSTTEDSPNLTLVAGGTLVPGAPIVGAGIPAGAHVVSQAGASAVISADATATAAGVAVTQHLDAVGTRVGRNFFRGARGRVAHGSYTDRSRLMTIATPALLRSQQFGIWYPGSPHFTGIDEDITFSGFEFLFEDNGAVTIQGSIARAGGFPDALDLWTWPRWALPIVDQLVPVYGDTAALIGMAFLDASTGTLSLNDDLTGATSLHLGSHAWSALAAPDWTNPDLEAP
jgi:hypothetical protein